jgi:hypothetical protein
LNVLSNDEQFSLVKSFISNGFIFFNFSFLDIVFMPPVIQEIQLIMMPTSMGH